MTPPEEVLAFIEKKSHLLTFACKRLHPSLTISPMEFTEKARIDPTMWDKDLHPEVWGYDIEYILTGIIHAPRLFLRTPEERDVAFERLQNMMSRYVTADLEKWTTCTRLRKATVCASNQSQLKHTICVWVFS